MVNQDAYHQLKKELDPKGVTLVAVSKTKPVAEIQDLYALGQRDFGENYVQELIEKHSQLPSDIHWHFIGHLQRNKVKYIAPFIHLIHGVDSYKLLEEINRQAEKQNRIIGCLLQIHIAEEETKFGLDATELEQIFTAIHANSGNLKNVQVKGLMGMASFTEDNEKVRQEFLALKNLFDKYSSLTILSMGMSSDYQIAIEEGSNMIRVGSLLFGERT